MSVSSTVYEIHVYSHIANYNLQVYPKYLSIKSLINLYKITRLYRYVDLPGLIRGLS